MIILYIQLSFLSRMNGKKIGVDKNFKMLDNKDVKKKDGCG
jgi:hypothetical protein